MTALSDDALYSGVLLFAIHLTLDGFMSSLPESLAASRFAVEAHRLFNRHMTELRSKPVASLQS